MPQWVNSVCPKEGSMQFYPTWTRLLSPLSFLFCFFIIFLFSFLFDFLMLKMSFLNNILIQEILCDLQLPSCFFCVATLWAAIVLCLCVILFKSWVCVKGVVQLTGLVKTCKPWLLWTQSHQMGKNEVLGSSHVKNLYMQSCIVMSDLPPCKGERYPTLINSVC